MIEVWTIVIVIEKVLLKYFQPLNSAYPMRNGDWTNVIISGTKSYQYFQHRDSAYLMGEGDWTNVIIPGNLFILIFSASGLSLPDGRRRLD